MKQHSEVWKHILILEQCNIMIMHDKCFIAKQQRHYCTTEHLKQSCRLKLRYIPLHVLAEVLHLT